MFFENEMTRVGFSFALPWMLAVLGIVLERVLYSISSNPQLGTTMLHMVAVLLLGVGGLGFFVKKSYDWFGIYDEASTFFLLAPCFIYIYLRQLENDNEEE